MNSSKQKTLSKRNKQGKPDAVPERARGKKVPPKPAGITSKRAAFQQLGKESTTAGMMKGVRNASAQKRYYKAGDQLAAMSIQLAAANKVLMLDAPVGPFLYSQLGNIQLFLLQSGCIVYFNSFFANIAASPPNHAQNIYGKYFQPLPSNPTPSPPGRPGSTSLWPPFSTTSPSAIPNMPPVGTTALGILFNLDRVAYSSRYGGSVELLFMLAENFGGEFAVREPQVQNAEARGFLIDCSTLEISVYIVPPKEAFNGASKWRQPASYAPPIVEIRPTLNSILRWRAAPAGNAPSGRFGPVLFETLTESEVQSAMTQVKDELVAYMNQLALTDTELRRLAPFVVGFVHNENRSLLTTDNEIVDGIAISNGCLDLWTHTGLVLFEIRVRVESLWVDTEPGGEELQVDLIGHHEFYADRRQGPETRWYRDLPAEMPFTDRPYITLPWYRIGMWPVEELYEHDSTGNRIQLTDGAGQPLTMLDGSPCFQLRLSHFLVGVQARVIENDPFISDVLRVSTMVDGEARNYGTEDAWALRELNFWVRDSSAETPIEECAYTDWEVAFRQLSTANPASVVINEKEEEVVLGQLGYYWLVFQLVAHWR